MAKEKVEKKTAILLQAAEFPKNKNIIRSIHVVKTGKTIEYQVVEVDDGEIRKHYGNLPPQAKIRLSRLGGTGIDLIEQEINMRFKTQRSGISYEVYFASAFLRKRLEDFEFLKPFAQVIRWYHVAPNPLTGNLMTAPCSFSTFRPLLKFEVLRPNERLTLECYVVINNSSYPLTGFRRFAFFLESRNEYFLLSYKDYQTLEWFSNTDLTAYESDPFLFAQNILSKLEETYAVNRNNHFAVNVIETRPVERVLLSEISNSFLVLTPQWMYDGFLAEGPWKESFETTVNSDSVLVRRDKELETAFMRKLEALHPNFPRQLNGYYYLSFADAQKKQWFLKVYHQLLEQNVEMLGMDMLSHFRYSPHRPSTEVVVVKQESDMLTLQFSVKFGEEEVPLPELQKILLAGQRAVMLKDSSLGILADEWLTQYASIIKHGKIDKKYLYVPRWLAVSNEDSDIGSIKKTIKEEWWEKWERWRNGTSIIYPLPAGINATLRSYQQKGYEWMRLLSEMNAGACLADDMGLGKTLQTICFIVHRLAGSDKRKALIICPSSLIYNWQQEIEKFAPAFQACVHHGITRSMDLVKADSTRICITSYGTLRSDIGLFSEILFDVAVVDESHNIKNAATQSTRAVIQLQAINRIALSGTPVMNNTFDLYSQLQFLLPGMFGSREFFKREYADPIDRDNDPEKVKALLKLTTPFVLRRTKEQVAPDLPEKTEAVLWCSMKPGQKAMYDSIRDNIRSNLFLNIKTEGLGKSKLAVLAGIMKLRQVCSSALLLPPEEQTCAESVKQEILMAEISNLLPAHKVIVFSQFSKMLDLLEVSFTDKKICYFKIDGQTPPKKRAEMVSAFQEEGCNTHVFLISLMAGNTGLTLTAADYVFLFDPWWNNAVERQAIDRTHRIGQTKNIFAYKMICKDTIEEKIMQLQNRKKELSENLVGEAETFVKQLTQDDIAYLFG